MATVRQCADCLQPRVGGFLEAFADEVVGEHGEEDGEAGNRISHHISWIARRPD